MAAVAPVYAVGMQMHWANSIPKPVADLDKIIARLASLGVKVKFTELDVMVGHLEPEKRASEQALLAEYEPKPSYDAALKALKSRRAPADHQRRGDRSPAPGG